MRAHTDRGRDRRADAPTLGRTRIRVDHASMLQLQRDAGNRAVVDALQRDATKLPAPTPAPTAAGAGEGAPASVPIIGPVPKPVSKALPKADPGAKAQPLGETQVTGSTPPSFDIVPTPAKKGRYAAKVRPVKDGEIQISTTYPAPDLYDLGSSKVIVDKDASDRIRDGEQEHSNDHHLAFHDVYDVVSGAINALAAKPPTCGEDRGAVHLYWHRALAAALPAQLRAPESDTSPSGPWSKALAMLHDLSHERDTKGWHNMILQPALWPQYKEYKVKKGTDLKRVYPGAASIGKHGSQERIEAVAPWLKKRKG